MPTDQTPKQLIVERIKNASNVLVTVGKNPSVDALAAALGLTLFFDKIDKIATAVVSGQIPPAIEFLEPGKTFDENVDGLRDFIIALDKTKADRLRYKVEDDVVRVFITPYKTTITEKDLTFSQGDFNVDLVVALGVDKKEDLDTAITAHGRILHDATTVSINQLAGSGSLGEVDWSEPDASSLCEMLIGLTEALQPGTMDQQIATALLTGLVSATDRFRNNKTSPKVMTIAAQLMAAGANQQLIADKLEEAEGLSTGQLNKSTATASTEAPSGQVVKANDGEMKIGHDETTPETPAISVQAQTVAEKNASDALAEANQALSNTLEQQAAIATPQDDRQPRQSSWRDIPAPSVGGTLNATTEEAEEEKRREEADTRNRVLLSHDTADVSSTPSVSTPPALNATTLAAEEPEVKDIFALPPASPQDAPTLQPQASPLAELPVIPAGEHITTASGISFEETPAPVTAPAPTEPQTLADLEAEVRKQAEQQPTAQAAPTIPSGVDDARAAVDAAFSGQDFNPSGQPTFGLGAQPLGEVSHDTSAQPYTQVTPPVPVPAPPALPPLPDFSTLPPLPGEVVDPTTPPPAPSFGLPEQAPDVAHPADLAAPSNDPTQFKLPGQN